MEGIYFKGEEKPVTPRARTYAAGTECESTNPVRSFRLKLSTINILEELAEETNMGGADIVEMAILSAAETIRLFNSKNA